MGLVQSTSWFKTSLNHRPGIESSRHAEVSNLKKKALVTAFSNFVFGCAPILVTLASFGTYAAVGEENLTADKVFVCLTLFNLLRLPMILLPHGIQEVFP